MKTTKVMLVVLVIIFSSMSLFAQSATEKGRIILDSDIFYNLSTVEHDDDWDTESESTEMVLNLRAGYTVIDDLEMGVIIGLNDTSEKIENEFFEMDDSDNVTYLGLFARYYFLNGKQWRPFAALHGGFGAGTHTEKNVEDIKYSLTFVGGGAGIAYFINTHWGIELLTSYGMISTSDDDDHALSSDMNTTELDISVGAIFTF